MTVTYRDGIAILELIVYVPCFFLALWLAIRHGITRSSAWYFLTIFTLIRVVGSCCQLATISKPFDIGLNTAAVICSSIGLSPLILTCVGLLARANDSSTDYGRRKSILRPWIFQALVVVTLVGLVLCIVGSVKSSNSGSTNDLGKPQTLTKVGIVLFIAAWAGLCLLLLVMALSSSLVEKGEHRLLTVVAISVPFILIRLIYSLVVVFANDRRFNIVTGSVTINLVMAVLEEFVVTILCIGVGLTLQLRAQKSDERVKTEHHSDRMTGRHVSQRVRPRTRRGPIARLIGLARARWT